MLKKTLLWFFLPLHCFIVLASFPLTAFPFDSEQQLLRLKEEFDSLDAYGSDTNPSDSLELVTQLLFHLEQLKAEVTLDGKNISLKDAVFYGIKNNPIIDAANSNSLQSEWEFSSVKNSWFPTLEFANGNPLFGYEYDSINTQSFIERFNSTSQSLPSAGDVTANPPLQSSSSSSDSNQSSGFTSIDTQSFSSFSTFQPGLSFSWSFFDPSRQPRINSAGKSFDQQRFLSVVAARSLVLNIQQTYYQVQSLRELIDTFTNINNINVTRLKMVRKQEAIGMLSKLDVQQAKAQLFSQLNQLINYYYLYLDRSSFLSYQIGMNNTSYALASDPIKIYSTWNDSLPDTLSHAVLYREEILASLAASESAKWSGLSIMREYLPIFKLTASSSFTLQNGLFSAPVKDVSKLYEKNKSFSNSSLGVQFIWRFFDGGVKSATAKSLYASSSRYKYDAISNKNEAIAQVRSSYSKYQSSRVAIKSALESYESASLAQLVARQRFSIGVGTITSLVQTMSQVGLSAVNLFQSFAEYNTSVAELHRYSATWPYEDILSLDTFSPLAD